MIETEQAPEVSERAIEEWRVSVDATPLAGEVLFMVNFKHRTQPFQFLHSHYKTVHEARREEALLTKDLEALREDRFREKYQIGYDLKPTLL